MRAAPARYVSDVAYVRSIIDEIAPEWLDLAATIAGFAPPARRPGYDWCELGCGQGLTPIALAAARPEGRFTGIDMMPDHIAAARDVAARARIGNAAFHALDFADAAELNLPRFDYIVAHGVYAWVDGAAQDALRRFVDRHLADGGLVYLSYNSLPGWAADAPFQYLARTLADRVDGPSDTRYAAAAGTIGRLMTTGAPALEASPAARRLRDGGDDRPLSYFAHEYLAPAWRPRYVTEVRAAMAAIGLAPLASATLVENFDALVLRAVARAELDAFDDPDLRELARDYVLFQRFRRDVFGRGVPRVAAEERRRRLLATRFALARPAGLVEYALRTEAGEVRFDNPVARAIVERLASGPRAVAACGDAATRDADLVANMLMLACADMAAPCSAGDGDVAALNRVLLDEPGEGVQHVLPSGIAMRFGRALLEAPDTIVAASGRAWADYLAAQNSPGTSR